MKLPLYRKPRKKSTTKYPKFYQHENKDHICKVTGPKTYEVLTLQDTRVVHHKRSTIGITTKAIFDRLEWTQCTSKEWADFQARYAVKYDFRSVPMDYVTTIGGVPIFQYRQIEDMPAGRAEEAKIIMMELGATMDRGEMRAALMEALKCLEPNAEGITPLGKAREVLKNILNRMEVTYNFNLYKKFTAFWFIEEGEDPTQYHPERIKNKLARWESAGGIDFFLDLPLKELLPSGIASKEGLKDYLKKAEVKRQILQERLKGLTNGSII